MRKLLSVVSCGALLALGGTVNAAPASGRPAAVDQLWPDLPPSNRDRGSSAQAVRPAAPPVQAVPERQTKQKPKANVKVVSKKPAPLPVPEVAVGTVICEASYATNNTQANLAVNYGPDAVETDLDSSNGGRVKGSVVYPYDPRRRLEVFWRDEAPLRNISVVAINGQSRWLAPNGVRLGMTLGELERINGRPFTLSGIDSDGGASVTGWDGGALAAPAGGCTIGVRLAVDGRRTVDGSRLSGDLLSNDARLRGINLRAAEILIGY